ncbi:MAG: sensor domain-containing protein [Gammaproteobacteria bacterium]
MDTVKRSPPLGNDTERAGAVHAHVELFEHAAAGLYRLDAAGRLVYANPVLARLLGHLSAEELLRVRTDFRAGLYADPHHVERLGARLETHGRVEDLEAELLQADKERIWVAETVVVIRDTEERKLGEAGTLININRRRIAEKAFARSEEKYRTLIEHSQDGVYVMQNSRIVYANAVLTRMCGYTPDEVVGEKAESFFAPSERAQYAEFQRAREGGSREDFYYETRLLARDGKTEVPVSIHSGPIRYLGENAILGTVRDLSEAYRARRRLEEAEMRYHDIVEHAVAGIYQSTPAGDLLRANPALLRMLDHDSLAGLKAEVDRVQNLYAVPGAREAALEKLYAEGSLTDKELLLRRRDGTTVWVSESARVVRDDSGRIAYFEGILKDISARKLAEAQLRHRAEHDLLTGLANRDRFREDLAVALEAARREEGPGHAVLFADLDVVKRVNDGLGYAQGDRLLKAAATRLCEEAGPNDILCRYSGERFALLAEGVASRPAAEKMAQRIEAAFDAPFPIRGHEIYTRMRIGIAPCEPASENPEAVLRNADAALFECKRLGKARFVFFDDEVRNAAEGRLRLESDMHAGLDRGEFEMHYQPIRDLATQRIVAFESLLRWRHPERGLLDAGAFISVAEETGLIHDLGRLGFHAALNDCMNWQVGGAEVAVAFNLSNLQFGIERLPEWIERKLESTGLPPHLLHLEVTEEVFRESPARARRMFGRFQELGVQVHMDDYGTGRSGFSWLCELPFDALKIDRSFVNRFPHDERTRAILKGIIALADGLDIDVIAEGVECKEEAVALAEANCRFVQGYFYGAATDAEATLALLRSERLHS